MGTPVSPADQPRHKATLNPKNQRTRQSLQIPFSLLVILSVTALTLWVWASQGSYALWNDTEPVPEASITVGNTDTPNLSITQGTKPGPNDQTTVAIDPSIWGALLPGEVVGTQITVSNQGSQSTILTGALDMPADSLAADISIRLGTGVCKSGIIYGQQLTSTPLALQTPALGPGDSALFCLQVKLATSAPNSLQGTQLVPSYTLTIAGTES